MIVSHAYASMVPTYHRSNYLCHVRMPYFMGACSYIITPFYLYTLMFLVPFTTGVIPKSSCPIDVDPPNLLYAMALICAP